MATGSTSEYNLPYPLDVDPVNVHGDIQDLAERIELVLPTVSGLPYFSYLVTNESGSNIAKGDPVYITGYSETTSKTTVAKSDADDLSTFPAIGLAQSNIADGTDGIMIISGTFSDIDTSENTAGDILYVASGGGLTSTQPANGSGIIGVVAKAHVSGVILLGQVTGNGTWGSMKAGMN